MALTNQDMVDLVAFRRSLHRIPELSREEAATAREVQAFLAPTQPDRVVTGLGGHGVAAVYEGREPGPTVMFRAELDGLPIEEISAIPHRSTTPGRGHLCGHDGHMAVLAALARTLGRQRPQRGRVVLMFQPAEEDGSGAAAVIADPRFREIAPDFAFALHNLPGMPFGKVALAEGPVNCASRGMRIVLTGKTAHASMPEFGISPVDVVAQLMPALTGLGKGGPLEEGFSMVTVTHAKIGEAAFGVAPGHAEIWATLRTLTDAGMEDLCASAEQLVLSAARQKGLGVEISYDDIFQHCENAPEAVAHLRRALEEEGVPYDRGQLPIRASEDFGRFGHRAPAAMFFLGAGENHPSLHNPDYDFPDDLIAIGARVFIRTLRNLLG
ncbi:amidohydrolase [Microvirga arsenatis]|uniref:Amidohydrolase n=1 Tax=Microvirga arsenatis TaxID=2692265 RepID=A0ABW9YSQ7_9HYPH|nr:amidohydrolase [Microvirga arsenatis]NBJ10076.1 amidohydrolase [Microvirga arsenatis]NBJ23144.1 amidohydrolase [Microvirga arsenatis]